jgi:isoquinoline 1-oxidoreductase alpha subunit
MTTLTVNEKKVQLDAAPDTPLLWGCATNLGLTETKYG